jgi:5'-3' exonuclease
MGVPGFFLWLWKKYKSKNFVFPKTNIPEIDNNYINNVDYFLLDMNCMIHPVCFETLKEIKPDENIDLDRLENKMINNVIIYLEKLINIAEPKKGILLAIDGVAPVAKMKQQRLRRYKSINDKEIFDNIRRKHKKEIPYFWSNSAITPGTLFMKKLTDKLNNWCKDYNNNLEIIFSSSNNPGEGEHKLLQFIRNNKTIYNYVVYGLDADLIFLMLATGLDTIYLMREAQQMENKSNSGINFVSIQTMKHCIIDTIKNYNSDLEFPIEIDNKRIIDDFIFICYLMGNDFLPHIPALDIYDNAIDKLLECYIVNLQLNGYIINNNNINSDNYYSLLEKLAVNEEQTIVESFGKKKRIFKCQSSDPFDIEMHKIDNLMFKIEDPIKLGEGNMVEWRERFYNHNYYTNTGINTSINDIDEFANKMVNHYNIGLKWVTMYYFDKCPSWQWHYPFDHPPFLNDMIKNKCNFNAIQFQLGEPLTPFEQLLIVLPKESSYLLPKELRKIMTNINGSASHLYPDKFELDMIGKKKYWMCNPILPNLEINLIRKMFEKYYKTVPDEIKLMNKNISLFH